MSKGMTLLYIEDDPQARDAANSLFSDFFDDVIVGFDGEDGARLFASNYHKIDLVITDITMPRMNGIEMIRRIREEKDFEETPIIVMSAYGKRVIDDALQAGANDFVEKPIDFDKFLSTVKAKLPAA